MTRRRARVPDHASNGATWTLDVYLAREDRTIALEAEHAVWAAPLRFAGRALPGGDTGLREALAAFDYAPWLVANLTLDEAPRDRHGAPLAWDNVLYDSAALGYVVATHQSACLASRADRDHVVPAALR